MRTLTVNSHKGGVGKTTISVNMAVHLARHGHRVCLLDNDFSGPAVYTFFEQYIGEEIDHIEDYFDGKAEIKDVIIDLSDQLGLSGKLYVIFANASPDSINRMMRADEIESKKILIGLTKITKELQNEPFNVEMMIVDSAPGLNFSTINSFLVSDTILFVIKMSNADIFGTVNMIDGLFGDIDKKLSMVANMIPPDRISSQNKKNRLEDLIAFKIKEIHKDSKIDFLGWVPTDMDLQKIEFDNAVQMLEGGVSNRKIFTLEQPDHAFSEEIDSILKQIEKY